MVLTSKWVNRFMDTADLISEWSKDRSVGVGAVIIEPVTKSIVATGYNGFPRGVDDSVSSRHERPCKYKWTEHAERNAIYNAAAKGISTVGCSIILQWYPCADCARAIIQSGISSVFCVEPDWEDSKWGEDFKVTKVMFEEANIKVHFVTERKKIERKT